MKLSLAISSLLALSGSTRAALYRGDAPRATHINPIEFSQANAPEPTAAPELEIVRRQLAEGETRYVADNNTCVYITEDLYHAYSCNSGNYCVFQTASELGDGKVMCCDEQGLDCDLLFTTCYEEAVSETITRQSDRFALTCSGDDLDSQSLCQTISISPGILDYYCVSETSSTDVVAYFTHSGERNRDFTAFYMRDGEMTSRVVTDILQPGPEPEPTTTSEPETETETETESTTSSAPSAETTIPDNNDDDDDPPIGAIVGGVVGGVAAIAIGAFALFCFFRRRRSRKNAENAHPDVVYTASPQSAPMHHSYQPKDYYGQPASYIGTASPQPYNGGFSPSMTDQRVSTVSAQGQGYWAVPGPDPSGTPPGMGELHEAPGRPSERRESERQELA